MNDNAKIKEYIMTNRLVLEAAFFFAFSFILANLSGVQNTKACAELLAAAGESGAAGGTGNATFIEMVRVSFKLGFTGNGLYGSLAMFVGFIGYEILMMVRDCEKAFFWVFFRPDEKKAQDFHLKLNLITTACFVIMYVAMVFFELQTSTFPFTVMDAVIGNFSIVLMYLSGLFVLHFIRKAFVRKVYNGPVPKMVQDAENPENKEEIEQK